jgi:recombination protein RecT
MSNLKTWRTSLKDAHSKFTAINPEKATSELGFAMQIFQNSETLQKCDSQSILNAVVNVARTSVTLNPVMRLAYLVPRKGKCVLDFSYMGLVAMLRDNNCIKSISAHIVYEDEEFDYDVAYNKISHRPRYAKTEDEHKSRGRIGCYSRATLPNGEVVFEFMPMWEIEKVKRLSEGSSSKYSAWQTWEEEMIKKMEGSAPKKNDKEDKSSSKKSSKPNPKNFEKPKISKSQRDAMIQKLKKKLPNQSWIYKEKIRINLISEIG